MQGRAAGRLQPRVGGPADGAQRKGVRVVPARMLLRYLDKLRTRLSRQEIERAHGSSRRRCSSYHAREQAAPTGAGSASALAAAGGARAAAGASVDVTSDGDLTVQRAAGIPGGRAATCASGGRRSRRWGSLATLLAYAISPGVQPRGRARGAQRQARGQARVRSRPRCVARRSMVRLHLRAAAAARACAKQPLRGTPADRAAAAQPQTGTPRRRTAAAARGEPDLSARPMPACVLASRSGHGAARPAQGSRRSRSGTQRRRRGLPPGRGRRRRCRRWLWALAPTWVMDHCASRLGEAFTLTFAPSGMTARDVQRSGGGQDAVHGAAGAGAVGGRELAAWRRSMGAQLGDRADRAPSTCASASCCCRRSTASGCASTSRRSWRRRGATWRAGRWASRCACRRTRGDHARGDPARRLRRRSGADGSAEARRSPSCSTPVHARCAVLRALLERPSRERPTGAIGGRSTGSTR